MFKKLLVCLLPLVALVGCKGGSEPGPTSDVPLNFTCEKGSVTVQYIFQNFAQLDTPNLEYSFDRQNWIPIEIEEDHYYFKTIVTINEQQPTVYFRGNNPNGFNFHPASETGVGASFTCLNFKFTDSSEDLLLKVSGNIMSLLTPEGFVNKFDIPCTGCFYSLFSNIELAGQGFDASGLVLPATELKDFAYQRMFEECDIAKAPSYLPAINAKVGCYESMFHFDYKLETAPIIKLKTLADTACRFMFYSCEKLNVTEKTGATLFFTCPSEEKFYDSIFLMFAGTATHELNTPESGVSYYYN